MIADSHEKLIQDFIFILEKEIEKFGTSTQRSEQKDAIMLIVQGFHCILGSLKNALSENDALVASLLQRYNYELMIDFYYLIDPSGERQKIQNFFSHTINDRQWSSCSKPEKEKYLPPWIVSQESTKQLYKKLSNLAHPNIISLRLNTKAKTYKDEITKEAISLCIVMISGCLNDQRFRKMYYQYGEEGQENSPYFEILKFQNRAISLLNKN